MDEPTGSGTKASPSLWVRTKILILKLLLLLCVIFIASNEVDQMKKRAVEYGYERGYQEGYKKAILESDKPFIRT